MAQRVNTNAVEVVLADEIPNPLDEVVPDEGQLLLEIREAAKTTVLQLPLVLPVCDLAVVMVVALIVEGPHAGEVLDLGLFVGWNVADVICDDINHDEDVHFMRTFNQTFEILLAAEFLIDFLEMLGPVSVVALAIVLDDGRNPDGVKTHVFDV